MLGTLLGLLTCLIGASSSSAVESDVTNKATSAESHSYVVKDLPSTPPESIDVPQKIAPLNPQTFAECLASVADPEAPLRLPTLPRRMAELYRESWKGTAPNFHQRLEGMKFVEFHSIPLVNPERHLHGSAAWKNYEPAKKIAGRALKRYRSDHPQASVLEALEARTEFLRLYGEERKFSQSPLQVAQRTEAFKAFDKRTTGYHRSGHLDLFQQVSYLSDPLVEWLLAQPSQSVSPWALIKKGLSLYEGDLLTTLGVIGQLFSMESINSDGFPREHLPLTSRMQKLMPNDSQDLAGHNYHFWAYLNLALQGYGPALNSRSFVYESLYQHDTGDRTADLLGMRAGQMTRKLIHQPQRHPPSCKL
jgi:hypothetical protein